MVRLRDTTDLRRIEEAAGIERGSLAALPDRNYAVIRAPGNFKEASRIADLLNASGLVDAYVKPDTMLPKM